MGSNPKVSVILPSYNRASYLPRSIRSVLSQTFSSLELILIDDGSTDNTGLVASAIKDSRFRYHRLPVNVGGAEARNVGISMARGEIISFQDSDDQWVAEKLEKTVAELDSDPNLGAVYTSFIQVGGAGCKLVPPRGKTYCKYAFYKALLWENVVGTPTLSVRKSILDEAGGFDPSMPRYQDWELALRLSQQTSFKHLEKPLLLAYVTENSITKNSAAHRIALEKIYEKNISEITKHRDLNAIWLQRLGDARVEESLQGGRRLLMKSLIYNPLDHKSLAKVALSLFLKGKAYGQAKDILKF